MLVVISDTHLCDLPCYSGDTIHAGAFRLFRQDLNQAILSACYLSDTEFSPIDECNVILLGDILDMIRTWRWHTMDVEHTDKTKEITTRPWLEHDSNFFTMLEQITEGILERNQQALSILKAMTQAPVTLAYPPGHGRDGDTFQVKINLHYMIGNHDWFLHLPAGMEINRIRQRIIDAMGLSNRPDLPFAHTIEEDALIQAICHRHRVYIQHGDIHDSANYVAAKGRDYSSGGDAFVIELVSRLAWEMQTELGLKDSDPLFLALKELDNVRPTIEVPTWFQAAVQQHRPEAMQVATKVLKRCINDFLSSPAARHWPIHYRCALKVCSMIHIGLLALLAKGLGRIGKLSQDDYIEQALREPDLHNDKADFVIYGHTHQAQTSPLFQHILPENSSLMKDKLYLNAGTWRRVHLRHKAKSASHGTDTYYPTHQLTWVAFYKDGERKGRKFETWSGTLG